MRLGETTGPGEADIHAFLHRVGVRMMVHDVLKESFRWAPAVIVPLVMMSILLYNIPSLRPGTGETYIDLMLLISLPLSIIVLLSRRSGILDRSPRKVAARIEDTSPGMKQVLTSAIGIPDEGVTRFQRIVLEHARRMVRKLDVGSHFVWKPDGDVVRTMAALIPLFLVVILMPFVPEPVPNIPDLIEPPPVVDPWDGSLSSTEVDSLHLEAVEIEDLAKEIEDLALESGDDDLMNASLEMRDIAAELEDMDENSSRAEASSLLARLNDVSDTLPSDHPGMGASTPLEDAADSLDGVGPTDPGVSDAVDDLSAALEAGDPKGAASALDALAALLPGASMSAGEQAALGDGLSQAGEGLSSSSTTAGLGEALSEAGDALSSGDTTSASQSLSDASDELVDNGVAMSQGDPGIQQGLGGSIDDMNRILDGGGSSSSDGSGGDGSGDDGGGGDGGGGDGSGGGDDGGGDDGSGGDGGSGEDGGGNGWGTGVNQDHYGDASAAEVDYDVVTELLEGGDPDSVLFLGGTGGGGDGYVGTAPTVGVDGTTVDYTHRTEAVLEDPSIPPGHRLRARDYFLTLEAWTQAPVSDQGSGGGEVSDGTGNIES